MKGRRGPFSSPHPGVSLKIIEELRLSAVKLTARILNYIPVITPVPLRAHTVRKYLWGFTGVSWMRTS